ncbi:MAG: hypothetical protein AAF830_05760 [Pseudomonadota bacterium]
MLLRSITEHVRTQNWTAVAIDFLIVVIGVFVGIQVANWNDARGEALRREQLLVSLARDVEDDLKELAEVREITEWRFSAVDAVLSEAGVDLLRKYPLPNGGFGEIGASQTFDPDVPGLAITAMFWVNTLDGNQQAYESLTATGDFRLIGDQELRSAIAAYYAGVDEFHEFEEGMKRIQTRSIAVAEAVGFGTGNSVSFEKLVEIVAENEHLAAALGTHWVYTDEHRNRNAELTEKGEKLLAMVEAR